MRNKDLWFGSIPSHWTYDKIGILFSERRTKVSDKDYAPLSVAKIGVVPQLATAVKTDAGDNRKLVCNGDFVINSRSDRKGSCGVADRDGSVSLINIVLTPRNEWNSRYVHYLMRSQPFSEEYYRYGRGIVADLWTTRYSEMKYILLPIPPRTEQDQIVRFLDWKISTINRLIENYRHHILAFREMEQRLIDESVIEGMKKTNLVYSNDIRWNIRYPENWNLQRLRESFFFRKGLSITKDNLKDTGIPVISYGQIHSKSNSGVGLSKKLIRYVSESYMDENQSCLVDTGDFIFADTSEDIAGCGNCVYIDWNETIFAGYHAIIAHPTATTNNKYLAYLFKSSTWRNQIHKKVNGVKVYSITQKMLKDTFILIPSLKEQEQIVSYLDSISIKITNMVKVIERKIENLQELKTRLTADTVTGKIDVRNIEIPDYEFVGEESQAEEEFDAEGSDNGE